MTVWLLIGACLLVPPLWAVAVVRGIRGRERRLARSQRQAPPTDFQI